MTNSRTGQLIELGMTAYRSGLWVTAAERLQKAVEWDPADWGARLHLGMAYLKNKNYIEAHSTFMFIGKNCPNEDLQQKAWDAIELIRHRLMRPS
jgi:Flp pilus assembly protein TadD